MPYKIVIGKSFASADDAAKQAELHVNALPANSKPIGIAADAIVCCQSGRPTDGPGGLAGPPRPGSVEWDVYVLVKTS